MSEKEIQFTKYNNRSADYHYKQINKLNIRSLNSYTLARYNTQIRLIKKHLLFAKTNKEKQINILDVGCGDGVLLYLLKKQLQQYNFNMFGVDLSEIALKTAKTKIPSGNFKTTGVYDMGYQKEFFDIVISSDVIEHVNYPEKMLKEIKRISKKKNIIIIGTPIRYTEKPLDPMHVKEFFQQEYIDLFSEHFTFIKLVKSHKMLSVLKYIKQSNFLKIRFNRYFFNILTLIGKNMFMETIKSSKDFPTYMYVVCKN